MIWPLPTYKATCPGRHKRSPGIAMAIGTSGNFACSSDVRAMALPPARQDIIVSPEQSKHPGPSPPQQ